MQSKVVNESLKCVVERLLSGQWECSFVAREWSVRRRGKSLMEATDSACRAMATQLALLGVRDGSG